MSEQRWAVMCSMTGYWGVARPEHAYREDGLLACLEWESLHDTWAEAMQEADRQSRTITVTLPRKAATMQSAGYQRVVRFQHGDNFVYLTAPEHAEPFALALLAHARKEQHRG